MPMPIGYDDKEEQILDLAEMLVQLQADLTATEELHLTQRKARRVLVTKMHCEYGLTYRQLGSLLGISHARVENIVNGSSPKR